jgi:leader peptidase (prepilin peptidase)/N-methyltransferase
MEPCALSGCALREALWYAFQPALSALGGRVDDVAYAAPWFLPLVAGVVGAAMASLIGVVVVRLPRMRGWNGRREEGLGLASPGSHCDGCGAPVPPLALIPVAGWIAAKGRCGECGADVPWVYPAIEAAVAVASMAIVAAWGPGATAVTLLLLLWGMVLVSWIDLNENEIPDAATVPLFFLGLAASPFEADVMSRVLGAALAGGLLMLTFKITGAWKRADAMSLGDVALAGALGAWVGLCSVPAFLVGSCAAYVAYALPLRRAGRVWVPMGPALCAGAAMAAAYAGLRG